jgi:hypothetical protein
MAALVTVLGAVLAVLALLVAGLLRSHAEILRELHGLGVDMDPDADAAAGGSARARPGISVPRPRAEPRLAADVAGVTPSGDAARVAVVGARHPTLLAFLTSGCSTCSEFWSSFSAPHLQVPGDARLVVVTKGEEAESPARLRKFVPRDVLVVMSTAAWEAYDVPVAPYFAYVDGATSEIVGEGAAGSWEQLASMMEQAIADAGIQLPKKVRRKRSIASQDRAALVDRDLYAAGIEPGHPSLYPERGADIHEPGRSRP